MFGKNKKSAKKIVLEVQREDKIVSFVTEGYRKVNNENNYYYEVINPFNKKKKFSMMDIPAKYFSSGGVAHIYTPDLEQFYPVIPVIKENNNLREQVMTNEQKEWLKKGYRRNSLRGKDEGWLKRNQALIGTILVISMVIISVYFISSNLGGAMTHLTGSIDKLTTNLAHVPTVGVKPPA